MQKALNVKVIGRVQGVGFRPFVYKMAKAFGIKGTVQNNMDGVNIHAEGSEETLFDFTNSILVNAPRLSKVKEVKSEDAIFIGMDDFLIIPSERTGASQLIIPIDSAICQECLDEMRNPEDRRYQYPFINCTQCGPRYTIISELPYDRPYTSMDDFQMCKACEGEYNSPVDRRHHAQPIACHKCGPQVKLYDSSGSEIKTDNPIQSASTALEAGKIVAIKGLGGYHLSCNAENDNAVERLRLRKKRPNKPFAVMSASLGSIQNFALINETEKRLLESPEAPIVILEKKLPSSLSNLISPGMVTIGAMLPYTPLHHMLFDSMKLENLVMTSGNASGLPLVYRDKDALKYLEGIADYVLIHNRPILHPLDDSVMQISVMGPEIIRRSRGYVPDPISSHDDVNGIIAFGGQQKSTFTIGRNQQIFIGPHIGDLDNVETIQHFERELHHLLSWIDTPFHTAVLDAHPGYHSRENAKSFPFKDFVEVQHHHAHMAACMADNGLSGEAYGIILDGTGYGADGKIWGFEILYGDTGNFSREAHLKYTPLPGGDRAIRSPWKNASAMLISLLGHEGAEIAKQVFPTIEEEIAVISNMVEKGMNTVEAGSCGRLFDAVSSICGLIEESSYEGEAAIMLSELCCCKDHEHSVYPFDFEYVEGQIVFNFARMLKEISVDVLSGSDKSFISRKFHETLVVSIEKAMIVLFERYPDRAKQIVLSGGSFQNRWLSGRLKEVLENAGFRVYVHRGIPCNDGGLSFGQLIVAATRRRNIQCV
ncbi:carbamoyltransferase HypF [Bacillus massilinigeriensis]|uniref:carbamoyltransferase HypF n=1 Tax=Bacillus mediterraneensis TaxID=1805474 RepID=UPI0008F92992|nr:carbamoyltransferase HypF [Bacillus mediterraneensis]